MVHSSVLWVPPTPPNFASFGFRCCQDLREKEALSESTALSRETKEILASGLILLLYELTVLGVSNCTLLGDFFSLDVILDSSSWLPMAPNVCG